ncbi:MAG: hypothetical protein Q7R89_03380 [bacterium]|nr:hypothetical protein [bacterium]
MLYQLPPERAERQFGTGGELSRHYFIFKEVLYFTPPSLPRLVQAG